MTIYYIAFSVSIIVGTVIALRTFGKSILSDIRGWKKGKQAEFVLCSNCGERVKPIREARQDLGGEYYEAKVCPSCNEEFD